MIVINADVRGQGSAGWVVSDADDKAPGRDPSIAGKVVLRVVMGLVLLLGLSALQTGLSLLFAPGAPNQGGAIAAVVMGTVLSALSAAYFYHSFVAGPRRSAKLDRVRRLYPNQPWMERSDWAARKVAHTSGGVAIGLWIWCIGWWGILSFIGWVNYDKIMRALSESWWNGAFMAIFVGAGLLGLMAALRFTVTWLRYGTTILHIGTLPAHIGDRFKGALEARLRPPPKMPLDVELSCEQVRWVTTGSGKNRSSRLEVTPLGSAKSKLDPRQFSPMRAGTRATIEVNVPDGLPAYGLDAAGNGVRWVLTIATTGDDPPFSCSFEVPVYERR